MTADKPRPGWYELKPFFEWADDKYHDMHEITKRVREFSFFISRSGDGVMRLFIHLPDPSEAKVARGALKNAVMEPEAPKAFSASVLAHLKMRRHYAVPIAQSLVRPLVYATMDSIARSCFVAISARHHDESFQISQFAEKNLYNRPPLWSEVLRMLVSGSSSGIPKRSTSQQKLALFELAKEKQRLRHFHCAIAIGAQDLGAARSIAKALSEADGLVIDSIKKDAVFEHKAKKPLLFASHFCVLSDIELANMVSLPDNPRTYRFNVSRNPTWSSGPVASDD